MRIPLSIAMLIATAPILVASQRPASTNLFVVRDVRVFDGERTIGQTNVVVQDGRIQSVGGRVADISGATIVEGRGRTLLPGLIDSHVHVADDAQSALEQAIVMGVTTVLDMFSARERLKRLRQVAADDPPGVADVRTSGTGATAPGGHPTQMGGPVAFPTVASASEADAFVAARIAEGADYIKIIYDDLARSAPMLSRHTLEALVSAAHRRGKLAVVHVRSEPHTREAIEAGADVLAHLFRGPTASPDFGTFAAKYGVAIIPTFSAICANSEAQGLLTDAHLSPFLRPAWRQMLEIPTRLAHCGGAEAAIKQLIDAQVPILAGSDAPIPGTTYGASLHAELSLLVRSGLSPTQALAASTSVAARTFRLNDRGAIAPGLRADLVLVDGSDAGHSRDAPDQSCVEARSSRGTREPAEIEIEIGTACRRGLWPRSTSDNARPIDFSVAPCGSARTESISRLAARTRPAATADYLKVVARQRWAQSVSSWDEEATRPSALSYGVIIVAVSQSPGPLS